MSTQILHIYNNNLEFDWQVRQSNMQLLYRHMQMKSRVSKNVQLQETNNPIDEVNDVLYETILLHHVSEGHFQVLMWRRCRKKRLRGSLH